MTFLRQRPILFFAVFLLFVGLACQGVTAVVPTPEPVDEAKLIEAAVATVEAGLPAAAPVVQTNSTSGLDPVPTATAALAAAPSVPLTGDLQQSLINVYEQVNPAVVHIFVFDQSGSGLGTGSGFVVDNEGHIVTNNHVVADGSEWQVSFANGESSRATVVGTDVDSDLAVIRADTVPAGVEPVPLGDSTGIQVGQFVIAIGNPFGEAGSMSVGIVSGLGRTLVSQRIAEGGGRYSLPQVIQTDAAINPGNSGGPLLNLNGEVVGVNSAIQTQTGVSSGVGFSIPVAAVNRVLPALIADGEYIYPYMGIRMSSATINLQEFADLPQATGVYVTEVSPGTPAAEAGLVESGFNNTGPRRGGDLITAVDGNPVLEINDLISYLVFSAEVGQTIDLTVLRDGEEIVVPLTLGARP